ncbi:MAG: hypothetical protein U0441_30480 [Polyangiaceae bacterium]
MRRHLPIITIVACQVLLAGIAAFLFFVAVPQVAKVYEDFDGRLPRLTMLAFTGWFLPSLPVVAIACDALALVVSKKTTRNTLLGAGLVLPAFGLLAAIWGLYVPLFESAPGP